MSLSRYLLPGNPSLSVMKQFFLSTLQRPKKVFKNRRIETVTINSTLHGATPEISYQYL